MKFCIRKLFLDLLVVTFNSGNVVCSFAFVKVKCGIERAADVNESAPPTAVDYIVLLFASLLAQFEFLTLGHYRVTVLTSRHLPSTFTFTGTSGRKAVCCNTFLYRRGGTIIMNYYFLMLDLCI